jgi:hypothetical protein
MILVEKREPKEKILQKIAKQLVRIKNVQANNMPKKS